MQNAVVTPELLLASGWTEKNHHNGFIEYKQMVGYKDEQGSVRKKKQSITYYTTINGISKVHVHLSYNLNVFDETIRETALTIDHLEDALRVCDLSERIRLNY